MPARSPSNRPLLIAATSGRALAAAAKRAGYRPLVADFFCDDDTRALADRVARLPGDLRSGIDGRSLIACLSALAEGEEPVAFVYGSGFEDRPELLAEVGPHFPLAGNSAETVRRLKDPEAFARDCAASGIPHPAVSFKVPPDPENWLVKRIGASGGAHVRRAGGAAAPGFYFQRRVPGRNLSVLFVGDGQAARIVGFSRQWASPAPGAPHRYGGAVRLKRVDRHQAETIGAWLSALTARTGLKGLCSADFIRAPEGLYLVEVNPRPGATLDIFDSDEAPLIEAHLRATEGAPFRLPRFADCMASVIVYTREPIERFPAIAWPDGVADRQAPGTRLQPGEPVCTALARGPNAAATRRAAGDLAERLRQNWEEPT